MKIVIRSRYINTFLVGFRSFLIFYPEKVKDLIVQVQHDRDTIAFVEAGKLYGFEVKIVPVDRAFYDNEWAYMLYKSLQYDDVVSLDDDIVFLDSGLFSLLDAIHNETKLSIVGTRYTTDKGLDIVHSHLISKRKIDLTKDFFSDKQTVWEYDGVDSALISQKLPDDIAYLDDHIKMNKHINYTGFMHNQYYVHVGGVSCLWHGIYNKIINRRK